jgi:hypothetical protein
MNSSDKKALLEKLTPIEEEKKENQFDSINTTTKSNNINNNTDDDYNQKKYPILIMLLKILYWIIFLILLFLGIFYLIKSNNPSYHLKEKNFNKISLDWNNTYYNDLQDWTIKIKNSQNDSLILDKYYSKINTFTGADKLYFKPFQFIKNNTVSLLRKINLERKNFESSYGGYNLSANLYLNIDNTFSVKTIKIDKIDFFIKDLIENITNKDDCYNEKSSWNFETETCYKFYILKSLCLIIDQKTRELYYDYKHFKCNGFDNWYEAYYFFPWTIPNFDPNFYDIQEQGKKINIYISTNNDPYVYAIYNDGFKLNLNYKSYLRTGIWFLGIAFFFVLIPVLLILRDYYETNNNTQMTAQKSKIFMTSFRTNPLRI